MGRLLGRWRFWRRRPALALQLRVERERTAIGRCSDSVAQALAGQVPAEAQHDVLVVLDELLTNVIMHAEQAAGAIDVDLRLGRGAIKLTISYLAVEFDPTTWGAASAGTTVATSRIGGLGITIVRKLMDEFHYEYSDGRNTLRLLKRC